MTEKKRIRIESNGRCYREGDTRVFIDGEDVSHQISDVVWSIGAHHGLNLSKATITFTGVELAVEYVAEEVESSGPEGVTVVPSAYFDELVADLDALPEPNERAREAARLLRDVVRSPGVEDHELILRDNPELVQQIREGVEEAEAGQTVCLGAFAEHLDDEDGEPGA